MQTDILIYIVTAIMQQSPNCSLFLLTENKVITPYHTILDDHMKSGRHVIILCSFNLDRVLSGIINIFVDYSNNLTLTGIQGGNIITILSYSWPYWHMIEYNAFANSEDISKSVERGTKPLASFNDNLFQRAPFQ